MSEAARVPVSSPLPVRRALFVATILVGSFLLFLVQPMVARMALPQLGGAPNVWNSAMLVYQALLLGGYGYAHWLGRFGLARQAAIHIGLLALAALTLPIAIADLRPAAPGSEVWWVPLLFLVSVGPVFFLVSAQAPLMQRWFAAHPQAGEPWALYAASNLGSFAGLIAYPLLAEPLLALGAQSVMWSIGYGLLVLLIVLAALARRQIATAAAQQPATADDDEVIGAKRIFLWLALSAVPSGLLLSTTTHLTTDVFAMPLLWVIPLALYLLSFVFAFATNRAVVWIVTLLAPLDMLLAGGLAMDSRSSGTLMPVLVSVLLLFVVAVALHGRLYDLRPKPAKLTLFYFVMSAGGALGGVFTALVAPLVFDWAWEHPLLVFAAAMLLPMPRVLDWRRLPGLAPEMVGIGIAALLAFAAFLAWHLADAARAAEPTAMRFWLVLGLVAIGMLVAFRRPAFLAVLLMLLISQNGIETLQTSFKGERMRSYFGIYTVRDHPAQRMRTLAHGTTLHGQQSTDPAHARDATSYYGAGSGIGIVLGQAQAMYGSRARIGVVGLGTGTLACYHRPGEQWRIYEIDPLVLELSRRRIFTYLQDCAPDAKVIIGDARLELAREPRGSFDVLAIDAFSSDAIPLHLLTDEAFGIYLDVLSPHGLLIVHISNRYLELEPVLAAAAKRRGLIAAVRGDNPYDSTVLTPSSWVALTHDPARIEALRAAKSGAAWNALKPPAPRAWTDDHASILPYIRWENLVKQPS